ncbi:hypothetical protein P5673_011583 [Acropora cervicornis]|uniref:Uncharacterized protein n=1 Tax=Acropora cervicornis TaxID=6130 RepID=A0AAD9QP69_ACRCE|nr:hypothetical protein P5673_011583 [Acropora cervicornis]
MFSTGIDCGVSSLKHGPSLSLLALDKKPRAPVLSATVEHNALCRRIDRVVIPSTWASLLCTIAEQNDFFSAFGPFDSVSSNVARTDTDEDALSIKQMVSFSTHINGHSLDLVVVRNSEPLGPVVNIETIDPSLSDHLAVPEF